MTELENTIDSEGGKQFYRCHLCNRVVSEWDLEKHSACPNCGHSKISPANLTFFEKLVQVCKHPVVWKW